MNKKLFLVALALVLVAVAGTFMISRPTPVRASDHDDGETDTKSRNTNLTDLYIFREGDQDGVTTGGAQGVGDNDKVVIALNLNPRSLPRQQYFFNTTANYIINVGIPQPTGTNQSLSQPTGAPNFQLRFTFGAPDQSGNPATADGRQEISVSKVPFTGASPSATPNFSAAETVANFGQTQRDLPGIQADSSQGSSGGTAVNEQVAASANTLTEDALTATGISSFTLDSQTVRVFAGLREDPFFFDVTQFFRVRAGLLGDGPLAFPRTTSTAVDFTKDYNVLSLVLECPIAFLQNGNSNATTFDVFATIEQPNN